MTIRELLAELIDLYEARAATEDELAAYQQALPADVQPFELRRACRILNSRPWPSGTKAPPPRWLREAVDRIRHSDKNPTPPPPPKRERPKGLTLSQWMAELQREGLTADQIAEIV